MKILIPIALGGVIALLVTPVIGGMFLLLSANQSNELVATVVNIGDNLVDPFRGIFEPRDPELSNALAWGMASLFYVVIASALGMVFKRH